MNVMSAVPLALSPDALFQKVTAAWDAARDGKPLAPRSALRPALLGSALPYVCLVDVIRDVTPIDFRYRLCGHYLVNQYGVNVTGHMQRALITAVPDGQPILDAMLLVEASGEPKRFRAVYPNVNGAMRRLTAMLFPLTETGERVDTILGSGIFEDVVR